MLTREKFAWVMDVGLSTVDQWQRDRALAYFKKGRTTRYEPAAVAGFVLRYTVAPRRLGGGLVQPVRLEPEQFEVLWDRIERLVQMRTAELPTFDRAA